ncbi:MAG: dienelactone hydrolase family protein [Maritimibacter sp.]|nr:dienelactone hydrolase family protein [Maritimibacter sp.]
MKTILTFAAALALSAPALAGEAVSYEAAGTSFDAYWEAPVGARGTVVILPTWNGLSDYEMDRAKMLAEAGYNALAVDLYGGSARPQSPEDKEAALNAVFADGDRLRAILAATVGKAESLAGGGNVVMLGYSMGGGAAMELVRSGLGAELGVDGYAVFSGRVSDPGGRMIPDGTAPIFVAHGTEDGRVPVSGLVNFADDLDLAGVEHRIEIYEGAGHLFSAFGFPNYDPELDAASWEALGAFLESLTEAGGAS